MPAHASEINQSATLPLRAVQRRSRLHYLYYLLAAFDLVTVTLSLLLINQVAGSFSESVQMNELWATRINDFAALSRLAAAVNAPGNDVFESRDVPAEADRFEAALQQFNEQRDHVRSRVLAHEAAEASQLLPALDDVETAMERMAVESQAIFTSLSENDFDRAGAHMAAMDRSYLAVNVALAELTSRAQAIQEDHLARSAARARAVRRWELVVAGLILVMIAGVTVYGARLARQVRLQAQLTEALVVERTRELERSHERLRTAERLASIGTLAAGLGHDMNNVLFPVRCRLDVLDDTGLPDPAHGELRSIRSSVEYLQQLSDGLRLLSVDSEQGGEAGGSTDLASWGRQVEPLLRTALHKNIALRIDLPPDLSEAAIAPHQLTQAVFNLVVNAGEAIEGAGEVAITAAMAEAPGAIRISVRDTGTGMTDEVRRQALDPFFTTKKRTLSTGLGLALVHGIATAAGGTVEIQTRRGAGTTVSIVIPAVSTRDAVDRERERLRAILAISDERFSSFMASVLEARGWICRTVPLPVSQPLDDDADAWIVSTEAVTPEIAEPFLAGAPRRRIVLVCNEIPDEWDMPGVIPLRPSSGLAEIMAAAQVLSARMRGDVEPEAAAP